jgi:hypothetical protein
MHERIFYCKRIAHDFAYETMLLGIESTPIYTRIVYGHGFAYQTIPIYTNAQPICTAV